LAEAPSVSVSFEGSEWDYLTEEIPIRILSRDKDKVTIAGGRTPDNVNLTKDTYEDLAAAPAPAAVESKGKTAPAPPGDNSNDDKDNTTTIIVVVVVVVVVVAAGVVVGIILYRRKKSKVDAAQESSKSGTAS
jgi:hypothetical protein